MKKYLLVVTLVTLMAPIAFSQIAGGVRLGANVSNQKAELDGDTEVGDAKIGFLLGLYLTANISEKIAIQPELFYSGVGSKDGDISINTNYLSVPILLRYNINEMINIHVGPQLGFLVSAKAAFDGNSIDVKDGFNSIDFGATIGAGLDFGKFNAGARYNLGLSDIQKSDGDATDFNVTNRTFQIFVGYRLFGGQ